MHAWPFPGQTACPRNSRTITPAEWEQDVQTIHLEDAVARIPDGRATLLERAPGIPVSQIVAAAELVVAGDVPEMCL
jgi:hypothetical protein